MKLASFVLACLLIPAAAGCASQEATASVDPPSAPTELGARVGTFHGRHLLTGELEAVQSEKIVVPRTPVWSVTLRWMEEDGATVAEGQTVVELDNTQFTGELAQKELAESSAYNELVRKRADVAVTVSEKEFALEERRILLEKARIQAEIPADIRSLREYQDDQLALARTETEYRKAKEDLESTREASQAEIEELRLALERTREEIRTARDAIGALTLNAPRSGLFVVTENRREGRKYQIGDTVWVGLPVARIPDLTSMKVVARLSDVDDGRIAVGMRTRSKLDIYPELHFNGTVSEITPIAQEESDSSMRRSFRVVILLDESDPDKMRPGMSVRVEVLPRPREDVLLVPRAALDWSDEAPRALLTDGSSVEVRLGPCNAQECVVEEGLSEGARLRGRV
jgi:multidrug efflux pump subunit AcrA (membrane-fusion protein)